MMFQIENTPYGYIVGAYVVDGNGYGQWVRLRNFGDYEGDARLFQMYDCPKLTDSQIRLLEKNFDINRKYIRVSSTRFVTQKEK